MRLGAARGAQVSCRLLVDAEEAHRCAVLGGHVGDRRAVHHRERRRTRAVEFNELANDLRLAKQLGDREGEVGRRHALAQGTGQVHADDVGREEIDRLAEHAGLGLDAADAPADDADAVDHRRVRVGADQGVRVDDAGGVGQDSLGEVLEVHLVDDADARGNDLEGVEGLHAPLEELIALLVAGELDVEVLGERLGVAGKVDLDRVVNDQVHRDQGLNQLGILPQLRDRRAHRGQVHEERHPGEVLQDDASDDKGDLLGAGGLGLPGGQGLHGRLRHALAIAVAQERLKHQPDRHRQARNREPRLLQGRNRIVAVRRTADCERLKGTEGIGGGAHETLTWLGRLGWRRSWEGPSGWPSARSRGRCRRCR